MPTNKTKKNDAKKSSITRLYLVVSQSGNISAFKTRDEARAYRCGNETIKVIDCTEVKRKGKTRKHINVANVLPTTYAGAFTPPTASAIPAPARFSTLIG